jgi:hypothetical protein
MTELGGCVRRPPRGGTTSGPATIELADLPPDRARGRFESLRLRTSNEAAARLYAALGFRARDEATFTHVLELARRPA